VTSTTGGGARAAEASARHLLGIRVENVENLQAKLSKDFSAETWGFRQYRDIGDEVLRAVTSHEVLGSCDALVTNLCEARLHEEAFSAVHGSGMSMASPPTDETIRDLWRLKAEVVAFFRAFGSALDCLAAVAIGVVRVPRPLHRASFSWLTDERQTDSLLRGLADEHADALNDFLALVKDECQGASGDWLDWGLEMRNALMHRARHTSIELSRPRESGLIVVVSDPASLASMTKHDLYFVRHPWLSNMEYMALGSLEEALLREPAWQTMRGLAEFLGGFVERAAESLCNVWQAVDSGKSERKGMWNGLQDCSLSEHEARATIVYFHAAPATRPA